MKAQLKHRHTGIIIHCLIGWWGVLTTWLQQVYNLNAINGTENNSMETGILYNLWVCTYNADEIALWTCGAKCCPKLPFFHEESSLFLWCFMSSPPSTGRHFLFRLLGLCHCKDPRQRGAASILPHSCPVHTLSTEFAIVNSHDCVFFVLVGLWICFFILSTIVTHRTSFTRSSWCSAVTELHIVLWLHPSYNISFVSIWLL